MQLLSSKVSMFLDAFVEAIAYHSPCGSEPHSSLAVTMLKVGASFEERERMNPQKKFWDLIEPKTF